MIGKTKLNLKAQFKIPKINLKLDFSLKPKNNVKIPSIGKVTPISKIKVPKATQKIKIPKIKVGKFRTTK